MIIFVIAACISAKVVIFSSYEQFRNGLLSPIFNYIIRQ